MPPPIGFPPPLSSLISIKAHSVVNIIPATEAAFSNATRVTFLGSIIPANSISTYSSVLALYPKSPVPSATLATTTEPSRPAFSTIVLNGDSTARDTIWIPVAKKTI